MATTQQTITADDGWVQVASAADADFLIENQSGNDLFIAFGAAPGAGVSGHQVRINESIIRVAAGDVFARSSGASTVVVSV